MPTGVGDWDKVRVEGGRLRGEDGFSRRKGRVQQMFCCRAGSETRNWVWREHIKKQKSPQRHFQGEISYFYFQGNLQRIYINLEQFGMF